MPNSVGRSWITKARYQWLLGTVIAACIIAAGTVPSLISTSETRARQDADRIQQTHADMEIKKAAHQAEVKVVCGITDYILKVTAPAPYGENPDAGTIARVDTANAQRREGRATWYSSQDPNIIKECTPNPTP